VSQAAARPDFGYVDDAERRRHPRQAVHVAAEITIGNAVHCECTIVDISLGGAQLAIPKGFTVPDEFLLTPPSRLCRVAWRKDDRVGVAFQAEEPFSGI
jgi:PilZ domain